MVATEAPSKRRGWWQAAVGLGLGSALLICAPAAARAGLDLAWNACSSAGGDSVTTFHCGTIDSVARLFGCFQVPKDIPRFFAMDVVLDVTTETYELPPFWHLEPAGCNRTGAVISAASPETLLAGVLNPWGPQGAAATATTGYGATHGARNRGRFVCAVFRASNDPTTLIAGKNYYGFELRLFSDNARSSGGDCAGCDVPVTIRWVSCTFYSAPAKRGEKAPAPVVVEGPGLAQCCVRANGARGVGCMVESAAADSLGRTDR